MSPVKKAAAAAKKTAPPKKAGPAKATTAKRATVKKTVATPAKRTSAKRATVKRAAPSQADCGGQEGRSGQEGPSQEGHTGQEDARPRRSPKKTAGKRAVPGQEHGRQGGAGRRDRAGYQAGCDPEGGGRSTRVSPAGRPAFHPLTAARSSGTSTSQPRRVDRTTRIGRPRRPASSRWRAKDPGPYEKANPAVGRAPR